MASPSDDLDEKARAGVNYVDRTPVQEESVTGEDTRAEEKRAVRKLDFYLISVLFALNLCSFLDRGNIGNAYTAGMGKTLGLTSNDYSMLITMYFIAYVCFQWLILVWKVVSPPVFAMCSALGFGTISILQAATTTYRGELACRFFLGVFEAAFAPGVPLYLSFFYNRREMGLRYGVFISSAALASCFASALAYGILQAHTGIAGWRLLFIIEGSPTIIFAIIAGFVLPSSPESCRFLSPRETALVMARAVKARGIEQKGRLNPTQVLAAFKDYKNYLSAIIVFCLNATYNALPAFLPTIIDDIGIGTSPLDAQGLSAPPYLAAFLVCVTCSYLSDRFETRGAFMFSLCSLSAIGFVLLALVSTPGIRYLATFFVCAGGFPAVALMFTWVTDNQGSDSKRGAGLVVFGAIGQCGSILGAHLFPASEAPRFRKGMSINAGLLFFAAFLTVVLSLCLRWQNRRRDRKFGKVEGGKMPQDIFEVGDEHPMYRYVI